MATVEDVQRSLVSMIAGILYPEGVEAPAAVSTDVMVYAGWPVPDQLDKDIAAGKVHISIFTRPEERNVTRGLHREDEALVGPDTGTVVKVVRQQEQLFQITIWAPTPEIREEIGGLIDPILSDTYRFQLPDQTMAQMHYRNHIDGDFTQKAAIFRKELFYYVEYATTRSETAYVIKENDVNIIREFDINVGRS